MKVDENLDIEVKWLLEAQFPDGLCNKLLNSYNEAQELIDADEKIIRENNIGWSITRVITLKQFHSCNANWRDKVNDRGEK